MLDLEDISDDIKLSKQTLPHKYPLSHLYVGTMIGE